MNKEPNESGRRQFTPEQKFKIVKEALTTDLGVSGVCRKYGVSASNFYQWQEKFFSGAIEGLKRSKTEGPTMAQLRRIAEQEQKIHRMQNVIADITAENIDFKKKLGDF